MATRRNRRGARELPPTDPEQPEVVEPEVVQEEREEVTDTPPTRRSLLRQGTELDDIFNPLIDAYYQRTNLKDHPEALKAVEGGFNTMFIHLFAYANTRVRAFHRNMEFREKIKRRLGEVDDHGNFVYLDTKEALAYLNIELKDDQSTIDVVKLMMEVSREEPQLDRLMGQIMSGEEGASGSAILSRKAQEDPIMRERVRQFIAEFDKTELKPPKKRKEQSPSKKAVKAKKVSSRKRAVKKNRGQRYGTPARRTPKTRK